MGDCRETGDAHRIDTLAYSRGTYEYAGMARSNRDVRQRGFCLRLGYAEGPLGAVRPDMDENHW